MSATAAVTSCLLAFDGGTVCSRVASLPSPPFDSIPFWPRPLTMYGLMIGLGIVAATYLTRARMRDRSIHPDTAVEMLMWVVPAGLIGARAYHVITDWKPFDQWLQIWKGGLGVPGAIAGGAVAGILFARTRGLPVGRVADAVAPALPLAQALGRWGNWWNQELYGTETELPWGLTVDHEPGKLFHPTFLYESVWNLGVCVFLIWLDKKGKLKQGRLIWAYVATYSVGRLWIETIRADPATLIAGVRVNVWVMGGLLAMALAVLAQSRRSTDRSGSKDDQPGGADASEVQREGDPMRDEAERDKELRDEKPRHEVAHDQELNDEEPSGEELSDEEPSDEEPSGEEPSDEELSKEELSDEELRDEEE